MADLFAPNDLPELDCPACGKRFPLADDEALCPACGWTPADGDAPRLRAIEKRPTAPADVRVDPPGRPRSVLVCILLGVVTLGLYFLVWHYAAFQEVRLHTRTRQRTDLFWGAVAVAIVGIVWAVIEAYRSGWDLGLPHPSPVTVTFQAAGAALMATYLYVETRHLRDAAQAMGVASLAWPAGFYLIAVLQVAGDATGSRVPDPLPVLTAIAALLVYPFVQLTMNEYWRRAKITGTTVAATAAPA